MDPVNRIHFGSGEIGHNINTMEQMAGQFFEVFDFTDPVHFVDDAIQDRFDLFVSLLLEEWPLALQPRLMTEKFLFVKGSDMSLFAAV